MSQDPRNIFVDQRKQYADPKAEDATTTEQTESEQPKSYEERVAEMKALAAKYQREGEGQLVKDIVNNVIEQKASGKLSNKQLTAFANRIMPLLNSEQKQRLGALMEQLLKL